MITKEDIEKRIQELDEMEKRAWADLNHIIGARGDCIYWLGKFDKVEDDKTETPVDTNG